jgi:DNA primase
MEIERIDYRDAIKELARTANFDLTPYERNPEIHEKRQQERQILKTVNAHAQDYFRSQFAGSIAESYIVDKRKLTTITRDIFGIGYAPESYVGLIDYLKAKGCSAEEMMQAGLVTK